MISPATTMGATSSIIAYVVGAHTLRVELDWAAYLVSTVRDFVVWGMPPGGMVDQCKAEWLISASQRTKASRAIVREVIGIACEVDDVLTGLGRSRRACIEPDQRDTAGFEDWERTLAPDAESSEPVNQIVA